MGATVYPRMAPAEADDAEWMSGKSRHRLAPVLTEASSWTSDRSAQRGSRFGGEGTSPKEKEYCSQVHNRALGEKSRIPPGAIETGRAGLDATKPCAIMRPMRRS